MRRTVFAKLNTQLEVLKLQEAQEAADVAFFESLNPAEAESFTEYLRVHGGNFVMASQVFKDYRPIIQELQQQGWEVQQTANATHWKCTPKDKTKEIVHFAVSDDPHAFDNNLARLRQNGFVWPAPSKNEQKSANGNGHSRRERSPLTQRLDLSNVSPKHNTEEEHVEAAASGTSLRAGCTETPSEETMDQMYRELKEAKAYVVLADDAHADAKQKMQAAKAVLDEAEREHTKALRELQKKKDAFDKAFNSAAA